MKKLLILSLLAVPFFASAALVPTSIYRDTAGGFIRPIISTDGLRLPSLTGCDTIDTDGDGDFVCGTDGGGGGGGIAWPFTKQASGSQATSTVMQWIGGFVSSASSTLTDFTASIATTSKLNIFQSTQALTAGYATAPANYAIKLDDDENIPAYIYLRNDSNDQGDMVLQAGRVWIHGYALNLANTSAIEGFPPMLAPAGVFTIQMGYGSLLNFRHSPSNNSWIQPGDATAGGGSLDTAADGYFWWKSTMQDVSTGKAHVFDTTVARTQGTLFNVREAGTDLVVIDHAGNVGIGTTTPDQKLNVQGTASTTNLIVSVNATTTRLYATNATTTNLSATIASTSQFTLSGASDGCATFGNSGRLTSTGVACGSGGGMTFAWPFTLQTTGAQSTSTLMEFSGGFNSSASSTVGANTTASGLTIFGGATTTGQMLNLGSTTLQSFTATNGTTTNATSTSLAVSGLASTSELRVGNRGLFGGSVGIGTNAPGTKLEVTDASGNAPFKVNTNANNATNFTSGNASVYSYFTPTGGDQWHLGAGTTNVSDFGIANTTRGTNALSITGGAGGNKIGIGGVVAATNWLSAAVDLGAGTNVPTNAITVGHSGGTSGFSAGSGAQNNVSFLWDDATGKAHLSMRRGGTPFVNFLTFQDQRVGIASTTPWANFAINPTAGEAANQFVVGSSTATNFIINNSGYVGVGEISPASLFTVGSGDKFQVNASGDVLAHGSTTLQNFTAVNSTTTGQTLKLGSTTLQSFTATFSTTTQATSTTLFNTGLGSFGNLFVSGSTTLQNFTATNSTTTNATSTTLFNTGLGSFGNIFTGGSTTLQRFTATHGTTTQATSTNSFATNLWADVVAFGQNVIRITTNTLTGTGVWDLGGATSFETVNGSAPTVDATGEIAVDTTGDQLIYFGSAFKRVLQPFDNLGFAYATSTTWTGTTTLRIGPSPAAITIQSVLCETNTGTVGVSLYDGTNRADYIPNASTTIDRFVYKASNNSFTDRETIRVDIGTPASSPTAISCRFSFTYDAT